MDEQSSAERPSGAPRKQCILLVDDEPDILDSLRDLLEACIDGVQVQCATSGAAALQALQERRMDLVISDYKMPGMNGLEFLGKAKELAPRVPRVLATAFPDVDIAVRAINEASIHSFVTKPFDPERLLQVVKDILAEGRASTSRDQSFARSMDLFRKAETQR